MRIIEVRRTLKSIRLVDTESTAPPNLTPVGTEDVSTAPWDIPQMMEVVVVPRLELPEILFPTRFKSKCKRKRREQRGWR